jgi:hypothetical protein
MMSLVMHGGGRLAPAYAARADPRQAAGSKASPAIRAFLSIGLAPVRRYLTSPTISKYRLSRFAGTSRETGPPAEMFHPLGAEVVARCESTTPTHPQAEISDRRS